MTKPFLRALKNLPCSVPPVWLMRQAGRYLPEYREVRERAGNFMGLVYNPALATEVTLQPIRRFGFDAAILFSDILVVPDALGQKLSFAENHGPCLRPFLDIADLNDAEFHKHLAPIYETVSSIREGLDREGFYDTALIGFAGSPWTVACYMVEGEGSKEFAKARLMALCEPEKFSALIDILVQKTSEYLLRQIEAGAEAVQLFDTWAGLLPPVQFEKWVIEPTQRIVSCLREKHPALPIIGFPRGAGLLYPDYAAKTGVTALGLDWQLPLFAAKELQKTIPVQGNLDPFVLLCGGRELDLAIGEILENLGNQSGFVFNLGHGIHKDTPPENVARLVARVRGR